MFRRLIKNNPRITNHVRKYSANFKQDDFNNNDDKMIIIGLFGIYYFIHVLCRK